MQCATRKIEPKDDLDYSLSLGTIAAGHTDDMMKPPLKPWQILLAALFFPGVGQLLNNMPQRALTMLLFLLFLTMVSYHLTTPQHSWLGRHAGGVFVYWMMVMDAHRWAKVRWDIYHARAKPNAGESEEK